MTGTGALTAGGPCARTWDLATAAGLGTVALRLPAAGMCSGAYRLQAETGALADFAHLTGAPAALPLPASASLLPRLWTKSCRQCLAILHYCSDRVL